MKYFWAVIIPPLAILLCKKPFQALFNFILWCFGVVPGIIHALFVVHSYESKKKHKELVEAVRGLKND